MAATGNILHTKAVHRLLFGDHLRVSTYKGRIKGGHRLLFGDHVRVSTYKGRIKGGHRLLFGIMLGSLLKAFYGIHIL